MTIGFYLFVGFFVILLGYLLLLNLLLIFLKEDKKALAYQGETPLVSVLIAARDEEANIVACLQAVNALSWPAPALEVLIGDDQSSDRTAEWVLDYIKEKSNFSLIRIEHTLGQAKGKANVLAHLARKAKGEFLFITDADVEVPTHWIQSLLANRETATGIVSGATRMKESTLFDYCQAVDWVYGFSMIKVASDWGIPVSAVGNNMMITAEAYRETGGYETIPFSVTEDHALFMATLKKGWQYKNTMSFDGLASTKPVKSLSRLLAQRKRWMQGAVKVPLVLLFFLVLQGIFLPVVLLGLWYFPEYTLLFWAQKIVLQQVFIALSCWRIKQPYNVVKGTVLYELYSGLLSPLVILYYLIPTRVVWKGRTY